MESFFIEKVYHGLDWNNLVNDWDHEEDNGWSMDPISHLVIKKHFSGYSENQGKI